MTKQHSDYVSNPTNTILVVLINFSEEIVVYQELFPRKGGEYVEQTYSTLVNFKFSVV